MEIVKDLKSADKVKVRGLLIRSKAFTRPFSLFLPRRVKGPFCFAKCLIPVLCL